ncbi:MAG: helix-hairpin-helix domain-containing protein [Alicyclobacillus sp.]|nr:helix-hairpin-helix domain-containing protein [Alicyclobacillus sp.]
MDAPEEAIELELSTPVGDRTSNVGAPGAFVANDPVLWDEPGFASSNHTARRLFSGWAKLSRLCGVLLVVGVSFTVGHWWWPMRGNVASSNDSSNVMNTAANAPTITSGGVITGNSTDVSGILVDVHGDVIHPGVYRLSPGARVQDAVRMAGGYRHPADANAVNAAAPVNDGDEIVIPRVVPNDSVQSSAPAGQQVGVPTASSAQGGPATAAPSSPSIGQIDVNTATLATLETLPDIGPTRAGAILTYRQQHGPFRAVSDLLNVPGIGPTIYGRIAPYCVVLGGEGH